MKKYIVFVWNHSWGPYEILTARRFTEEEKGRWAEWYREVGFYACPESPEDPRYELKALSWTDELVKSITSRGADGSFPSGGNNVYIITAAERDQLIELNAIRAREKAEAEKAEQVAYWSDIITKCERQGELYTEAEAARLRKQYNDIHNEGGFGYVPPFYTVNTYELAKAKLAELLGE